MTDIDQIRASIERRLAQLNKEVDSLTARRAKLLERAAAANGAAPASARRGRKPGTKTATAKPRTAGAAKSAPAGAAKSAPAGAAKSAPAGAAKSAPAGAAKSPRAVAAKPPKAAAAKPPKAGAAKSPAARARKLTAAGAARPRASAEPLSRPNVEALLRETGGLSATALAKRTGTPYAAAKEALDGFAADGLVRGSGRGRGSVWRLLTDEERIEARAAELEAQLAAVAAARAGAPPAPLRTRRRSLG